MRVQTKDELHIDDLELLKLKEKRVIKSKKLLNDIIKWTSLITFDGHDWFYDCGSLQNYAWELNESYKKLSKHLDVENLIS